MSEPYTPTTEEVRASYLSALTHNHPMNVGEVIAEFDRWLAGVKAEAFEQGFTTFERAWEADRVFPHDHISKDYNPYQEANNE